MRNTTLSVVFAGILSLSFQGFADQYGKAPLVTVPEHGTKRVFILAGQSNMVGYGDITTAPEIFKKRHERICIVSHGQMRRLVPNDRSGARGFGPELSFARRMANLYPDDTIIIIKVASGGTGIAAFLPDWSKEEADLTQDGQKGPLYKKIKAQIEQVKRIPGAKFMAFLWKQGGKDSRFEGPAKKYSENLNALAAGLREDTGVKNLPFIVATPMTQKRLDEALATGVRNKRRPYAEFVLQAQLDAERKIPHAYTLAHGSDLPKISDGVHFNTEGQIKLGEIFADKYEEIIAQMAGDPENDNQ